MIELILLIRMINRKSTKMSSLMIILDCEEQKISVIQ